MFKQALSSYIYIYFAFRDPNRYALSPCAFKHVMCNGCFGVRVGSKDGTRYSELVTLQFM